MDYCQPQKRPTTLKQYELKQHIMQRLIAHDPTACFPIFLDWVILAVFLSVMLFIFGTVKMTLLANFVGFSDVFLHESVYHFLMSLPARASRQRLAR